MSEPDIAGRDLDPHETCRCGHKVRISKTLRHGRYWARCPVCRREVAGTAEFVRDNIRGDRD